MTRPKLNNIIHSGIITAAVRVCISLNHNLDDMSVDIKQTWASSLLGIVSNASKSGLASTRICNLRR